MAVGAAGALDAAVGTIEKKGIDERLLEGLSPEDKTRTRAQLELQKQQEATAFVTNVIKKHNEIAMSVINNMR
jgi:hypothetical protein